MEDKIEWIIAKEKSHRRFWAGVYFAMSCVFLWLCFDWKRAKSFIFTGISIGLSVAYSIMSLDILPDWLAMIGVLDDLIVNFFGGSLAFASVLTTCGSVANAI